ncbi:hypothetical protein DCCM_2680 [Desulfocucumis palustris]|uniref:Uncharacterized protein n=1 Tax=Desulfocucumis palustris TaxID=1898651 RepID=A0A2L2XBA5_9FIRM|nr:hypothetical protein DCCM_2680 [Desulfocucumis palustris]
MHRRHFLFIASKKLFKPPEALLFFSFLIYIYLISFRKAGEVY